MGFQYLDQIATREHLQTFLQLTDLAAGAGDERRLVGPYDPEGLRALPSGSLGQTFVTVADAMGYDINVFPEPAFYNNLESGPWSWHSKPALTQAPGR